LLDDGNWKLEISEKSGKSKYAVFFVFCVLPVERSEVGTIGSHGEFSFGGVCFVLFCVATFRISRQKRVNFNSLLFSFHLSLSFAISSYSPHHSTFNIQSLFHNSR